MTQQQTMTKTLHPLDVPARLDEFKDMKDGWLGGEGMAPSHDGLDRLADMFVRHFQTIPHCRTLTQHLKVTSGWNGLTEKTP